LLPTDGLWHAAIYYLEPSSYIDQQLSGIQGNPFFAQTAPSGAYLAWAAIWFLLVLGAALVSFERREL
jgi:hypothetical protein